MKVYESKYWTISYEKENEMLIPEWNEKSAELTAELYKSEMEKYTEMVEKYRPCKALINCLKFSYAIDPDVQAWTNSNLFPRILAAGVRNVAILMPTELASQLSLEQVMDEELGVKFTTNYFSSEQDAREWLFK